MIANMNIFVFGNADLDMDSIPLKILPQLQAKFPKINFIVKDPNEEWDIPEDFIIIDTVVGIKEITVFKDIDKFVSAPSISMHDFDAFANIKLLKKLGKINKIMIIGIPVEIDHNLAIKEITSIIEKRAVVN